MFKTMKKMFNGDSGLLCLSCVVSGCVIVINMLVLSTAGHAVGNSMGIFLRQK